MADEPIVVRELEERCLRLSQAESEFLLNRHAGRIDLRPIVGSAGHWLLRPVHCCGVIALPGGRALHIEPKATIANLWHLLVGAWDLVELADDRVSLQTAPELLGYLASVFVRRCADICARGILCGYLPREDDLPVLRGRLDLLANVRRNSASPHLLACRFDEFTVDVPENRIVRSMLHLLAGSRLWPGRSPMRRTVMRCLSSLQAASLVAVTEADLDAVHITGLNRHYRTPLMLARLLLHSMGATHRPGDCLLPALLLDMPLVFERFVRRLLDDALADHGLRVRYHGHATSLDDAGRLTLVPDLLVTSGATPVCVVDAKYKLAAPAEVHSPASADVYQMLAYCIGYGVSDAILVYPERVLDDDSSRDALPVPLQVTREGVSARIYMLGLDLSGDPACFDRECARLAATVAALACAD